MACHGLPWPSMAFHDPCARVVRTRQDWEARAIAFLAAGNARTRDGTLISTWLKVHDEIARANATGLPMSESTRMAIVQMVRELEVALGTVRHRAPRRREPSGPWWRHGSCCGSCCGRC